MNRVSGVMVSVLTSSAVDREVGPRSGKTQDYKIGIQQSPSYKTTSSVMIDIKYSSPLVASPLSTQY